MTTLTLSSADPTGLKVDAIVIGIARGNGTPTLLPGAERVDAALGGTLAATLEQLGATGKVDAVTQRPAGGAGKASVVVAVGVGPVDDDGPTLEAIRRAAGAATRALKGTESAAFALPADGPEQAGAVAEGVLLGAYTFDLYKTNGEVKPPLAAATIVGPGANTKAAKQAVDRAEVIADAVNRARDWVNTPPRDLPPAELAAAAVSYAKGVKVDVEVLDEKALAKGGYGGILGVGQGSTRPPRLVRFRYQPARASRHVAFVGKGITFDSGGLTIKPAQGMNDMKSDMAGAAAVVQATLAIAELGLPVKVSTFVPMAENMVSGSATRPGDVLTMYGGKTVEVLNTDAEGRLILADGLGRAAEVKPDVVLDVATLTGHMVLALGDRVGGVMGTERVVDQVLAAGQVAGESHWAMPLPESIIERVQASKIADILQHDWNRSGGGLYAGAFLQQFTGELPWAHLDIAGPSFHTGSAYGHVTPGGTGFAVTTVVEYARSLTSR